MFDFNIFTTEFEEKKPAEPNANTETHLYHLYCLFNLVGACRHVDPVACRGVSRDQCRQKRWQQKCPNACGQCEGEYQQYYQRGRFILC